MRVHVKTTPRLAKNARCWLDGTEVSRDCFAADDKEGWADCVVRGDDGRLRLDTTQSYVLRERRYGKVRLDVPYINYATSEEVAA